MNVVMLQGNLTRDVELTYIASGIALAKTGIAVNKSKKEGDEWVNTPMFFDIVAWGKTAEIMEEHLTKGSPAVIHGELVFSSWVNKDGDKRSKVEVQANRVYPMAKRNAPVARAEASKTIDDDDVPF